MQVVIPKSSLEKHGACPAYLDSPEWDVGQQALVYADWHATADRLMSTRKGASHLGWLVDHKLVPMTMEEFLQVKQARYPVSLSPARRSDG